MKNIFDFFFGEAPTAVKVSILKKILFFFGEAPTPGKTLIVRQNIFCKLSRADPDTAVGASWQGRDRSNDVRDGPGRPGPTEQDPLGSGDRRRGPQDQGSPVQDHGRPQVSQVPNKDRVDRYARTRPLSRVF